MKYDSIYRLLFYYFFFTFIEIGVMNLIFELIMTNLSYLVINNGEKDVIYTYGTALIRSIIRNVSYNGHPRH